MSATSLTDQLQVRRSLSVICHDWRWISHYSLLAGHLPTIAENGEKKNTEIEKYSAILHEYLLANIVASVILELLDAMGRMTHMPDKSLNYELSSLFSLSRSQHKFFVNGGSQLLMRYRLVIASSVGGTRQA